MSSNDLVQKMLNKKREKIQRAQTLGDENPAFSGSVDNNEDLRLSNTYNEGQKLLRRATLLLERKAERRFDDSAESEDRRSVRTFVPISQKELMAQSPRSPAKSVSRNE